MIKKKNGIEVSARGYGNGQGTNLRCMPQNVATGWVAANDGNVSVKMGDGTWWITPSGISKSFITPDKLIRVNAAMEVVEGPAGYRPSSEMKMHMRCYAERADVGAVVHAHPPTATGYAVANKPLDAYSMIETVIAIGSIPVTPYGTPSTYEVPTPLRPTCRNTMCCCCRTTAR